MNVERDSDRQLRDWVDQGVDRAPERFVWAALDDIEQVPQRPAWRTRIDRALGTGGLGMARLRPVAGLVAVAAVALVALTIATVMGPGVGPPPASRAFAVADLERIVLWDDTKPASWTLDNLVSNTDEVVRIPIRSLTEAEFEELQNPSGVLAGRFTNFSGPDGAYMSWGLLFRNDLDAAAALPFYQNEMSSMDGWGLGEGELVALGDEGHVFEGETTAFVGPPGSGDPLRTTIYLWRDGNLLLALGGWFDYDEDELRAIAQGIDARADAVSQSR